MILPTMQYCTLDGIVYVCEYVCVCVCVCMGGILGHFRFGLSDNFHFGGVFWDTSDLDSDNFHLGGYSGTLQIWTL